MVVVKFGKGCAVHLRWRCRRPFGLFRDEEGFTTVGMALALLITLSLVFTTAQVYRVTSASADVQDVADAAALAAENQVAEFMIVVRACDAVVLTLSLTSIVVTGLGVAALCTPVTAPASEALLKAGRDVAKARDSFAEKAAEGLNRLQKALPFLAAASAAHVASANNGGPMNASYVALAVLAPAEGEPIEVGGMEGAHALADRAEAESEDIKRAGEQAEQAAEEANACKERAFRRDCGDEPGYCMSERARTLAGLSGGDNPRFNSVDAWSFSVPLERARAYYVKRLAVEAPQGSSTEERARSALRLRFYRFATAELGRGYVHETEAVSYTHLDVYKRQQRVLRTRGAAVPKRAHLCRRGAVAGAHRPHLRAAGEAHRRVISPGERPFAGRSSRARGHSAARVGRLGAHHS